MKIMWDKGHGGNDPGAVANGLQEKQLTHKIVEYAMAYLEANYTGFEQRVTRTSDQTLTLSQRADMANAWGADVFVSVHINAGKGTGFETYVYNGGVSSQTVALQNVLHGEILAAMRKFENVTDRGKKRADYAVLRETKMPAVLTENLFIDSNDAKHLKNEAFLKAVGEAHARGVAKFLGLKEKPKVRPEAKPQQKPSNKKLYRVQVGAFSDRKNAERLAEELKKKGYPVFIAD
ncbi:N-acetylmuramoyl-L-alanine amidase [Geobacillus stearothermophilus]|nr:N-acetylmuramoyl-L-alanine amidase [Geobacillus stearothermophilus]